MNLSSPNTVLNRMAAIDYADALHPVPTPTSSWIFILHGLSSHGNSF
ncbi:MAG TPA: hypothetical protein VND43_08270 [Burkholderiales bacterium]|nr:hypothetical protein [Burkholderiales bacterium]